MTANRMSNNLNRKDRHQYSHGGKERRIAIATA